MENLYNELIKSRQIILKNGECGIYSYSGQFLTVMEMIDKWFVQTIKNNYVCMEETYPDFLPIKEINRINYFSKFPTIPYIQYPIKNKEKENILMISSDAEKGKLKEDYFITNHTLLDEKQGMVFNPSTCYHTFITRKGEKICKDLEVVTAISQCVRNESTDYENPMRLRNFRMREAVFIGSKQLVENAAKDFFSILFREIKKLTDKAMTDYSSDIFFGQKATLMMEYQKETCQKEELIIPITNLANKRKVINLACASRNFHNSFLCNAFNIKATNYKVHSACVAIGVERLAYALLSNCGTNLKKWNDCELKKLILKNESTIQ